MTPVAAEVPRRRGDGGLLHREGSARLWLFRRHPERFPLPRPGELGPAAARAYGAGRAARERAAATGLKSSAVTRSRANAAPKQSASASMLSATDCS